MGALKVDRIRTWAVAFNPKGDLLATGGSDNQVKLWDLETTTQVDLLAGHTDPIRALAYSADGQILASTSADSTVILWDLRDLDDYLANYRRNGGGRGSRESDGIVESIATLTEHAEPLWAVTFSHDDRILATAGESGEIILRRFDQGTDEMFRAFAFRRKSEVKTDILEGHTDTVWALAFSPDDTLLASCSSDRTIKLWDPATNLCIATLEGHTDQVHAISISADGQFLISGGNDAAIRIWDIQKQELIRTLEKAHQHWIWAVACHPMFPSLFASGSIDELISLRETSGKEVSQFLNQPFSQCNIRKLICSPQEKDRFLGWGATDQEVKIV
jgi:WD40 repeat protein